MTDSADWLEVTLQASSNCSVEQIEEALLSTGAVSVTIKGSDDEIILIEPEPGALPVWDDAIVTGLYTKDSDLNLIQQQLRFLLGEQASLRTNALTDKVWELEWTKHFKPLCFANQLWICPSNQPIPESANPQQVITLDPGLAFGTGTHPTTAMVLEYLAKNRCDHQRVIDYGCGSGILGIAAVKMGATKAVLTDIDPLAIRTSLENAAINQVDNAINACLPELLNEYLDGQADLLIANILLTPLLALKDHFYTLMKPNTPIILTGLLTTQVDEIINHYDRQFAEFQITNSEDWAMVVATKN